MTHRRICPSCRGAMVRPYKTASGVQMEPCRACRDAKGRPTGKQTYHRLRKPVRTRELFPRGSGR